MTKFLRLIGLLVLAILTPIGVMAYKYYSTPGDSNLRVMYYFSRPPAYANSPYFSPEFLKEQFFFGSLFRTDEDGVVRMDDFKGHWYSVIDGHRGTSDQPVDAPH